MDIQSLKRALEKKAQEIEKQTKAGETSYEAGRLSAFTEVLALVNGVDGCVEFEEEAGSKR